MVPASMPPVVPAAQLTCSELSPGLTSFKVGVAGVKRSSVSGAAAAGVVVLVLATPFSKTQKLTAASALLQAPSWMPPPMIDGTGVVPLDGKIPVAVPPDTVAVMVEDRGVSCAPFVVSGGGQFALSDATSVNVGDVTVVVTVNVKLRPAAFAPVHSAMLILLSWSLPDSVIVSVCASTSEGEASRAASKARRRAMAPHPATGRPPGQAGNR